MPQPSKKKRDRLHSPQPRSEPAVRTQPTGPPPDAPEEVSLSEQRLQEACLAGVDVSGLETVTKLCGRSEFQEARSASMDVSGLKVATKVLRPLLQTESCV